MNERSHLCRSRWQCDRCGAAALLGRGVRRDAELRGTVEALIACPRQGRQLPGRARRRVSSHHRLSRPSPNAPARVIGPYKLLEQIGEGGMGVVYMAEQRNPSAARWRSKIIKPGMDTRQVIARFEAERQALAMMDHPEHRQGLRCRDDRQRPTVFRHGIGQRRRRSPSTAT